MVMEEEMVVENMMVNWILVKKSIKYWIKIIECGDCSGSSDNNRGGCDYEWSSSGGDW